MMMIKSYCYCSRNAMAHGVDLRVAIMIFLQACLLVVSLFIVLLCAQFSQNNFSTQSLIFSVVLIYLKGCLCWMIFLLILSL